MVHFNQTLNKTQVNFTTKHIKWATNVQLVELIVKEVANFKAENFI